MIAAEYQNIEWLAGTIPFTMAFFFVLKPCHATDDQKFKSCALWMPTVFIYPLNNNITIGKSVRIGFHSLPHICVHSFE